MRLVTSHGPLNLELHAEYTPQTAYNFVQLCARGYYDGVKFHRNIRNFMVCVWGCGVCLCLCVRGCR